MDAIIQVVQSQMNGEAVQTVNARELHAFLEVGKMFAHWIKDRIEQYGFIEHHDYVVFAETGNNSAGGRPAKEYAISLDMAKELAMVERNEKGKQARQYFIECERRVKSNVIDITQALADPERLRSALLVYTERVIQLEDTVAKQQPKVEFHDAVADAINCQTIQEVAKILDVGPNKLYKFLRDEKILMRNNLPYQQHIDSGHFRVVERQYKDPRGESHTYPKTLVTGKGLTYIQKRIDVMRKAS